MAPRSVPATRCCWWAPTARVVGSVSPSVPIGGAAFCVDPWHEVQVRSFTSRTPFTCVASCTVDCVYPAWQRPQSGFAVWGGGGGAPWQLPHASCVPSTLVHDGVVFDPPAARLAPWQ